MDYHSPDRTYKKSRFRRELERSVSRRLVTSLLLGCLLFLVAIAAVNTLNQNARREDHLAGVAATFQEVYNDTAARSSAWVRMFSILASSRVPYFWASVRAAPGMSVWTWTLKQSSSSPMTRLSPMPFR